MIIFWFIVFMIGMYFHGEKQFRAGYNNAIKNMKKTRYKKS